MTKFQYKVLSMVMAGLFVLAMFAVGREAVQSVLGGDVSDKRGTCVVIDAGHGGGRLR